MNTHGRFYPATLAGDKVPRKLPERIQLSDRWLNSFTGNMQRRISKDAVPPEFRFLERYVRTVLCNDKLMVES